MSKHSPGPGRWETGRIGDLFDARVLKDANNDEVAGGETDTGGGTSFGGVSVSDEDARLIAAAPELFDLLERLIAEDALSASNTAEAALLLARIEHGP